MKRVAYLYNDAITDYHFSKDHPMKTKRIKMAHSLITNYGLINSMRLFHSKQASRQQMCTFHHPNYIKYLQTWVSPKGSQIVEFYREDQKRKTREDSRLNNIYKINQSYDCPGFEGLYNFCQLASGGSIDAAHLISSGQADTVLNWSGGFHHGKKTQASGFCYINDIVLCILELLKTYPRVLYLDIDVHHGDGVQQAFYHTNRVMTVSFHMFEQDFFPGTGAIQSVGDGVGKFYSVNVPLKRGIDDITYLQLFRKVMTNVMGSYRPDVLVIQCGADSLAKDRLGHLNLSIKGHAQCIKHMMGYNVPMILLGGGGYTIQNVSRCWAYETAVVLKKQLDDEIPQNDRYYNSYEQDNHKLHFSVEQKANQNNQSYINSIVQTIVENLRQAEIRPSIAFHNAPRSFLPDEQNDWTMIDENQQSMVDSSFSSLLQKRQ